MFTPLSAKPHVLPVKFSGSAYIDHASIYASVSSRKAERIIEKAEKAIQSQQQQIEQLPNMRIEYRAYESSLIEGMASKGAVVRTDNGKSGVPKHFSQGVFETTGHFLKRVIKQASE